MVAPLAVGGTLLVAAAFYAATAHVAAAWVLDDQPLRDALLVGPAPAIVVTGGNVATLPVPLVVAAALLVDAFAAATVYDLDARRTALFTAAHLVVSVALGLALLGLLGLPG